MANANDLIGTTTALLEGASGYSGVQELRWGDMTETEALLVARIWQRLVPQPLPSELHEFRAEALRSPVLGLDELDPQTARTPALAKLLGVAHEVLQRDREAAKGARRRH